MKTSFVSAFILASLFAFINLSAYADGTPCPSPNTCTQQGGTNCQAGQEVCITGHPYYYTYGSPEFEKNLRDGVVRLRPSVYYSCSYKMRQFAAVQVNNNPKRVEFMCTSVGLHK
jgi:hypothetical protein